MTIEDIQTICRALPAVSEDIKWEHDLVFSVAAKMFCVVGLDQIPVSASFKVPDDLFEEMSCLPYFNPAPYIAKYKWVIVEDINKVSPEDWKQYIERSYALVRDKLPKGVKAKFGL